MGRWEPDSRGGCRRRPSLCTPSGGSTRPRPPRSPTRAGVTERTFFRHFADKREVLFGGSAVLQERIVAGVVGGARRATARSMPWPAVSTPPPPCSARSAGTCPPAPGRHRRQPRATGARTGQAGRLRRRGRRRPARAGRERAAGDPGRRGRHDGVARGPRAVGQRQRRPEPLRIMRDCMAELRAVTSGS